jgi:transcriptional regulator with XRE-family HTH domain
VQNVALGKRIKARREARGLSQQALASAADLATRTIARIEGGEDCNVRTLTKIAAVLAVGVAELIGEPSDGEALDIEPAAEVVG